MNLCLTLLASSLERLISRDVTVQQFQGAVKFKCIDGTDVVWYTCVLVPAWWFFDKTGPSQITRLSGVSACRRHRRTHVGQGNNLVACSGRSASGTRRTCVGVGSFAGWIAWYYSNITMFDDWLLEPLIILWLSLPANCWLQFLFGLHYQIEFLWLNQRRNYLHCWILKQRTSRAELGIKRGCLAWVWVFLFKAVVQFLGFFLIMHLLGAVRCGKRGFI